MAQQANRRTPSKGSDLAQFYRRIAGNKSHKQGKQSNKLSSILIVCIAVLAICVIVAGSMFIYTKDQNDIIAEGITIAGVNVGGMTKNEAMQAVSDGASKLFTDTPMTVKVMDTTIQISSDISKVTLDVRSAVNAAFNQKVAGPVNISAYLTLDESAVKNALSELDTKYNTSLIHSTAKVTGSAPNLTLVVKIGEPGYGLDMSKLYQQVISAYRSSTLTVKGECGIVEPAPVDLQPYWDVYHTDPVDACLDPQTFKFIESSDGYSFDIAEVTKQISEAEYGSKLEIPFTAIKPKVTSEELRSLLYRDTLSTYVAEEENSNADRNTNLRLACEAINGKVIYPNQTFSYNEALGKRTADRGYRPGPAIINGQMSTTIGGGICQVSSALYYCTLIADLKIIERDCHGFLPNYVPKGMDAAVSWGYMDFRFKNDTNYPIRIEAVAEGGKVTVKLIGTDIKDYYVKMEYVEDTSQTRLPDIIEQQMPADNPEGYKNGDYIVEPHTGCYITTYRCKYDISTNTLISREIEATSRYNKCDGIICVIVETPPSIDNPESQTPDTHTDNEEMN